MADLKAAARLRRQEILLDRIEIAWVVTLDALLLALSIVIRHYLLRVIHKVGPSDDFNFVLKAVETIADYGLIGTMAVVTAYDLLKRVRKSVAGLFRRDHVA